MVVEIKLNIFQHFSGVLLNLKKIQLQLEV